MTDNKIVTGDDIDQEYSNEAMLRPVPPTPATAGLRALDDMLADMRGRGWRVAVHNDYCLDGILHTFWLFTHSPSGRFVQGEALTDEQAIERAMQMERTLKEDGHG